MNKECQYVMLKSELADIAALLNKLCVWIK